MKCKSLYWSKKIYEENREEILKKRKEQTKKMERRTNIY